MSACRPMLRDEMKSTSSVLLCHALASVIRRYQASVARHNFATLDKLNAAFQRSVTHQTATANLLFCLIKFGADKGNRTPDLRITNALLYQLSYTGLLLSTFIKNDRQVN